MTPDGRSIYVAEWGARKVVRLRIEGAGSRTRTEIQINGSPDNLTWTPAGRLLVAAQEATPSEVLGCGAIQGGGCDVYYSVTEIDPETMTGDFIAWGGVRRALRFRSGARFSSAFSVVMPSKAIDPALRPMGRSRGRDAPFAAGPIPLRGPRRAG